MWQQLLITIDFGGVVWDNGCMDEMNIETCAGIMLMAWYDLDGSNTSTVQHQGRFPNLYTNAYLIGDPAYKCDIRDDINYI